MQKRQEILTKLDRLAEVDPVLLPEGSRYLLEIDFSSILNGNLEKPSYWVLAMKAAVKAGQRTVARSHHATARQRRAATASYNNARRVNGSRQGRTLGDATLDSPRTTRRRRVSREIARRGGSIMAGVEDTLRQIEIDFGAIPSRCRRRLSAAAGFLEYWDNKRWKPD